MTSPITTSSVLSIPLVGMHFHKPAKWLIEFLPVGSTLELVPDPSNPYDEKAVKVLVAVADALPVPQHSALDEALIGTGYDVLELVSAEGPLMLGHLADSDGKPLAKLQASGLEVQGNREAAELADACGGWDRVRATLGTMPDGAASVIVRAKGDRTDG